MPDAFAEIFPEIFSQSGRGELPGTAECEGIKAKPGSWSCRTTDSDSTHRDRVTSLPGDGRVFVLFCFCELFLGRIRSLV